MKFRLLSVSALLITLCSLSAFGAGGITGTLTINGKTFSELHVNALLHDNAERILPSPTQMRILVTDREMPVESIYGLVFLPVGDMGRRGKVEGVLLQFDPNKPGDVDYTVLTKQGLQTVTDKIGIAELHVGSEKVSGVFDYVDNSFASFPEYPKVSFNFRIEAPIKRPPAITADLKGSEALNSPQVKALRAIADATARGNFELLHKLYSAEAAMRNKEEIARLGAGAKTRYIRIGRDLKKQIPAVKRVVVRGDWAIVILPGQWACTFVFEDGVWKGE